MAVVQVLGSLRFGPVFFSRHSPYRRCRDAFMEMVFSAVSSKMRETVGTFHKRQ